MNRSTTKGLIVALPVFLMTGCASYYTHYAVFPAENSEGEPRQVRLTWQTADYPDWWFTGDKSTPITLETQCSSRKWRIVDSTHSDADRHSCAPGIRACGSARTDQFATAGSRDFDERACIRVNPADSGARVTDIASRMELLVSCRPLQASQQSAGETENTDYLRASPVPYTVYSRKGVRGRLDSKPPELDDSPCDDE